MPLKTETRTASDAAELESQLATVEGQTIRGRGNVGSSADREKRRKLDGSTFSGIFHHLFEAAADHKWLSCEKIAHKLPFFRERSERPGSDAVPPHGRRQVAPRGP
jgi:hypothetical protein